MVVDQLLLVVEQAHVAEAMERPHLVLKAAFRDQPDGKVDTIGVQILQHDVVVEDAERQPDSGRLPENGREQARAEQHLDASRRGNGEGALDRTWVEGVFPKHDRLELPQRRPCRLDEGHGTRRERHAVRNAGQQFVAEQLAQTRQAAAHRRLPYANLLRGASDAPLGQESIEGDEEVEVDAG